MKRMLGNKVLALVVILWIVYVIVWGILAIDGDIQEHSVLYFLAYLAIGEALFLALVSLQKKAMVRFFNSTNYQRSFIKPSVGGSIVIILHVIILVTIIFDWGSANNILVYGPLGLIFLNKDYQELWLYYSQDSFVYNGRGVRLDEIVKLEITKKGRSSFLTVISQDRSDLIAFSGRKKAAGQVVEIIKSIGGADFTFPNAIQ